MRKRRYENSSTAATTQNNCNGVEMTSTKNRKNFPKTRLPQRWLYCPPVGKVVANKFLPMKTPLDDSYDHLIESAKYQFHPNCIFKLPLVGASPGAKIGLWIDLTNSDNFYDGDEVRSNGSKFVKMKMVGHDQSPTEEQTTQFIECCNGFFKNNPKGIVAVHCTHGFNRTGFLIAAYLFQQEGLSIEMAVREFADSRPNGIYKQHYLDDLKERYGDEDDEDLVSPGRPLWENGPLSDEDFTNDGAFRLEQETMNGKIGNEQHESQLNNFGIAAADFPSSAQSSSTSNSSTVENNKNMPLFMDGKVPNVHYITDPELRRGVQEKSRIFCGYKSKGFPGSQPVSLEGQGGKGSTNNIQFLTQEPYMVSWKADGVRYLVLIDGKNRIFAFDRDNNPFRIDKMAFIRREAAYPRHPLRDDEFLANTLVDAEMVIDVVKQGANVEEVPRLLIYDLIYLQGKDIRAMDFNQRFAMIEDELIRPRTEAFKTGQLRRDQEPIGVRRKGFWPLEATYKFFKPGFLSCHEIDGLVFQPINRPYTAGRFEYLLKWKPPELSTIDFRLEVKKIVRPGELIQWVGELHVLHMDTPFACIIKATKQMQKLNGRIVECKYVRGTWEIMRERTDKSHPNAYATAKSVCNTIQFPIHKDYLLDYISKYAFGKNPTKKEEKSTDGEEKSTEEEQSTEGEEE